MAEQLSAPDGMILVCATCRWRPDGDLTVGVLAAHFETEHDTSHVRMELVVLCLRCDAEMAFERSAGSRDIFACAPCRRTRAIRRDPTP
jgi:transposase-like protein